MKAAGEKLFKTHVTVTEINPAVTDKELLFYGWRREAGQLQAAREGNH